MPIAPLPIFSNDRTVCARCGGRYEIRVHFDPAGAHVRVVRDEPEPLLAVVERYCEQRMP